MRKLKLQIHISIDGFVGGPNGEMDFKWDADTRNYSLTNLEEVDLILLALRRHTQMSFIPYWASAADNPKDPDFAIGKKLTDTPKLVFSRALAKSEWANTKVVNGEIVEEITQLKNSRAAI